MTKRRAITPSRIQSDFGNLTGIAQKVSYHIFVDCRRKAADPNCMAVLGPTIAGRLLRNGSAVLAGAIRGQRLVFRKIHTDRHPFDNAAGELNRFVHGLSVMELDVAKLAIFKLVNFQRDHLNLSCGFEEIYDILFGDVNCEITKPQCVPSFGLDALGLAPQNAAGFALCCCCGRCRLAVHLVHESKI